MDFQVRRLLYSLDGRQTRPVRWTSKSVASSNLSTADGPDSYDGLPSPSPPLIFRPPTDPTRTMDFQVRRLLYSLDGRQTRPVRWTSKSVASSNLSTADGPDSYDGLPSPSPPLFPRRSTDLEVHRTAPNCECDPCANSRTRRLVGPLATPPTHRSRRNRCSCWRH